MCVRKRFRVQFSGDKNSHQPFSTFLMFPQLVFAQFGKWLKNPRSSICFTQLTPLTISDLT